MTPYPWTHKISHPAQVGGIETAVLDNGAGRGTRVAWVNTGAGLRFKVVLDRGMDVAEAAFNQHGLAWLSHAGVTAPQPFSDRGLDWLRTFGGGLLTTCGLDHVGGPERDAFGERGLHGRISNTPAELESIIQPDPARGLLEFSLTGRMRETTVFGPSLQLKRTISGTLGQPLIRLRDEVSNLGNTPAPHMLLYHVNFGWPLVDEGTRLLWRGEWRAKEGGMNGEIFGGNHDFRTCPAPMEGHRGSGEAVAFIDAAPDAAGWCTAGLHNPNLGVAVAMRFPKAQLPWLINWQHWGPGEYVTALEPATHPPIGQAAAREQRTLIFLEPGESRAYDLELTVLHQPDAIADFLNQTS